MIKIKKSPTADTRSATEKVTHEKLLASSHQHVDDVRRTIYFMVGKLLSIADRHDWTKIDGIDQFYADFSAVQKDTDIDFKTLKWFKRHVTSERHHVNDFCPEDVNLFDLLERVSDITVAGMARKGKIYDDTLSPEILTKAYQNTVKLIKDSIVVED